MDRKTRLRDRHVYFLWMPFCLLDEKRERNIGCGNANTNTLLKKTILVQQRENKRQSIEYNQHEPKHKDVIITNTLSANYIQLNKRIIQTNRKSSRSITLFLLPTKHFCCWFLFPFSIDWVFPCWHQRLHHLHKFVCMQNLALYLEHLTKEREKTTQKINSEEAANKWDIVFIIPDNRQPQNDHCYIDNTLYIIDHSSDKCFSSRPFGWERAMQQSFEQRRNKESKHWHLNEKQPAKIDKLRRQRKRMLHFWSIFK